MGKLPWAKFFYSDFLQDTDILTPEAVGGWLRILCQMWHRNEGTLVVNINQLSRLLRTDETTAKRILLEIRSNVIANVNITEGNKKITITSRRINRETKDRENNRLRQQKFQGKKKDNGDITGQKSEAKKSEAKKSDNNPPIPPEETPGEIEAKLRRKTIQDIYDYWNTLYGPVVHRSIDAFISPINARLKDYTASEIKESMSNYAKILQSPDHYWSHKYGIKEFLEREKNNIDRFATRNDPFANFLHDSSKPPKETTAARKIRELREGR